ncbi:MAG: HAD family hydrolase [Parcubacteria group bacterium]|nr:HAD family hydrolase [Parcubacteria group bacterium]
MKKLIIFDFDGVLEDTFDWNFEVARKRYKNLDKEDYRTWFDGNIYEHPTVKAAGPMNVIEYFEEYKKGFENRIIKQEFKDVLFALRPKYHLVIISSIDDDIINPYLKRSKIDNIFEEVWGIRRKTSKVEKFKDFLELYHVSKEECLFITDTLGDIKEANKVGIESVGVTWGYQSRERLERGNPAQIVDTPQELLNYLL